MPLQVVPWKNSTCYGPGAPGPMVESGFGVTIHACPLPSSPGLPPPAFLPRRSMTRTLSEMFAWVKGKALSYLIIVAVLTAGAWAQREYRDIERHKERLENARAEIRKLDQGIEDLRTCRNPLCKAHARALSAQRAMEFDRDIFVARFPIATRIPGTARWKELKGLELEIGALVVITSAAERARIAQDKALSNALKEAKKSESEFHKLLEGNIVRRWLEERGREWEGLKPNLWIAAGLLAASIVAGVAIRVLLYFVIAPLASRRPAIRLLPEATGSIRSGSARSGADQDPGKASSVSIPVALAENQELLIKPEYLQSTSLRAEKRTRLFMNTAIPFSCLLSGMYLLTRVRSPPTDAVVVSATQDPLSEVGVIDLPEGAVFVCQPRSLAGVIQDTNHPLLISRHWRLGSLQAWLTLQLRFLVFHGPGQLVMKGCRGIRMEAPGKGRLINQAATLGFSANLAYANTRCETFMAYWTGKEDLFNDLFTGDGGSYVYEEMPDLKHKSGIGGRGLEGFVDAILKIFGI